MRTRTIQVILRLDEKEHAHLCKQSNLAGLTKSAFLRMLLLNKEIKPKPPEVYGALLHELSTISQNITQLTRDAKGMDTASREQYEMASGLVDSLWQLFRMRL